MSFEQALVRHAFFREARRERNRITIDVASSPSRCSAEKGALVGRLAGCLGSCR